MLDRRLFANFDWVLLSIVLMLCAVGIVAMYSATMGSPQLGRFLPRQVIWMGLGLALALTATMIDYRIWAQFGPSSWCGLSTDTGTVYRYRWAWFTSRALVTGGTRVRATLGVCQIDSCALLGALLPRGPAHRQIRHQGTHLAQFVDASSLAADPQTA